MQNELIQRAVDLLNKNELVAFPTETVYGLGADATSPAAVAKIFQAKGRPADHPVIVHIAHMHQLDDWAINIPHQTYDLAQRFWPGPLTFILQVAPWVPSIITGGQNSIGLRMPAHPMARDLLTAFGKGIAAPSANRFGKISPTTAAHVAEELGSKVSLILDGGPCKLGIESTIIDLMQQKAVILRPGPLTENDINAVTEIASQQNIKLKTRVSGSLDMHYAPRTPVYIMPWEEFPAMFMQNLKCAVISLHQPLAHHKTLAWIKMPSDPMLYAQKLYATLRELDAANAQSILIEKLPEEISWQAINDRLRRAAYKLL